MLGIVWLPGQEGKAELTYGRCRIDLGSNVWIFSDMHGTTQSRRLLSDAKRHFILLISLRALSKHKARLALDTGKHLLRGNERCKESELYSGGID